MAGLLTGLGKIQDAGYNMAKFGVVALTRSFVNTREPHLDVEVTEGIKAYAICPYFADTNLVRTAINLDDLRKRIKTRILTVEEVKPGSIFDQVVSNFECQKWNLIVIMAT